MSKGDNVPMGWLRAEGFPSDYILAEDALYEVNLVSSRTRYALILWPGLLLALVLLARSGILLLSWIVVVYVNFYLIGVLLRHRRASIYSRLTEETGLGELFVRIPWTDVDSAELAGRRMTMVIDGKEKHANVSNADLEATKSFLELRMREKGRVLPQ